MKTEEFDNHVQSVKSVTVDELYKILKQGVREGYGKHKVVFVSSKDYGSTLEIRADTVLTTGKSNHSLYILSDDSNVGRNVMISFFQD